jgi:hypothetical protein
VFGNTWLFRRYSKKVTYLLLRAEVVFFADEVLFVDLAEQHF